MKKEKILGYQFRTISNLIKRSTDAAIAARNIDDLTGVQGWVISYLSKTEKKQVFQKDVEQDLSMKSSTASRVLQLMEKNGFIVRETVEQDGRLKQVVPTKKLVETDKIIRAELENIEKKMRENISEEEMEAFFVTLQKIKANLEK